MLNGLSRSAMVALVGMLGVVAVSCSRASHAGEERVSRPEVSYLEEVVAPCTPIAGFDDPCAPTASHDDGILSDHGGVYLWYSLDDWPTFTDVLAATGRLDGVTGVDPILSAFRAVHVVVRATAKSDTVRCGVYPVQVFNFESSKPGSSARHSYCFADVRVNDYWVGMGPPELTVVLGKASLGSEYDDPDGNFARTRSVFEGRELVLFLGLPWSRAVEAWDSGGAFGAWFVQRDNGEIRAVSEYVDWAEDDAQRSRLDLPLEELEREVKKASLERVALTGGRIGADPGLPLLVTDANYLQSFYSTVGAVYEGEGATVLPPPVPGLEDSQ